MFTFYTLSQYSISVPSHAKYFRNCYSIQKMNLLKKLGIHNALRNVRIGVKILVLAFILTKYLERFIREA